MPVVERREKHEIEEKGKVDGKGEEGLTSMPFYSRSRGKELGKKREEKKMGAPELTGSRVLPMEAYVMNER